MTRIRTSAPAYRIAPSQAQVDRARGPIQPMPFTRRSVVAQITAALFCPAVPQSERCGSLFALACVAAVPVIGLTTWSIFG